ncbi:MAG: GGDEF domain-containing protein [Gemmatimonadota bacterium]
MSHPFAMPGRGTSRGWVDSIRAIWEPPDEFSVDAGKGAELMIAKVRLGLTLLLLLVPMFNLALAPKEERGQHVAGFFITLIAVLVALLVYLIVAQDRRQSWLPMATSLIDISLISFALVVFAFIGDPFQVVNSKITFETYFLALAATCLRYDARIAFVGGLMTIVQYLGIVIYVVRTFDLDNPLTPLSVYGRLQWSDQISRIILLSALTVLNVAIVRGLQKQRTLSSSDRLTNLFNRGYFDDFLSSEVARARRYGRPFSVAMIDVDHFKPFNDRYGHVAGDAALRSIAGTIKRAVRRSDVVARYGGEEFVVIFRESNGEGATERLETIRRAVEAELIKLPRRDEHVRVTVSGGLASWPWDGIEQEDLLTRADIRLFEAKAGGRNRVVGPMIAPLGEESGSREGLGEGLGIGTRDWD